MTVGKTFLKFISSEHGRMEHNSTQFPENILFQQTTCQVSASSPSGQNSEVQTEAQDSSERGVFRGGNKNIPAGTRYIMLTGIHSSNAGLV